jgi:hypothetical protein
MAQEQMILLESLTLTRYSWQEGSPLRGSVKFSGKAGSIELNLDEESARDVLAVCAKALVAHSQACANAMTGQLVGQLTANLLSKEISND